jgi:hypothetical protein
MRIAIALCGVLAITAIVLAYRQPLAEVPMVGEVKLTEMSWSGGGRQWVAIAGALLASILAFGLRSRALPAVFAALALGMWFDLGFSARTFANDRLAEAKEMQAMGLEAAVKWLPGIWAFGAAGFFLLAQTILVAYPARQSKAPAV